MLYAEPVELLAVQVRNDDDHPHRFHVHGLVYRIDSDGAWPFGVDSHSSTGGYGERSGDASCPGQQWCYLFDITEDTIGAWPFHDHHMHIAEAVDRGLFGGIVVRDPAWEHRDKPRTSYDRSFPTRPPPHTHKARPGTYTPGGMLAWMEVATWR